MNVFEVINKLPNFTQVLYQITAAGQGRLPESNWDIILSYACRDHVTVNNLPELNDYMNQHKRFIIRQLLELVREGNKWSNQYVNSLIRRLQKIGIIWHELKIITKSTKAIGKTYRDKKLQELNLELDAAEQLPVNAADTVDEIGRLLIIAVAEKITSKQCPRLLRLLEKNKEGILRILFKGIGTIARKYESKRLLKFGVTWPELLKLKNQYYGTNLKEAWWDEESDDRHIDYFIGLMIDGDKWAYENLNNLITDKVSKIKLAAALKKNMKWLIRWLTRNLSTFSLKEVIENLATMPDIIPEIRAGIEPLKESIVRDLLTQVKRGLHNRIIDQITAYKMLGITWKELDIIQRSIVADMRKTTAINESSEHTRATALEYINKSVAELILNINKTLNGDNESLIGPHSFCANAQYLMIRNLITRDDIRQSLENARVHIIMYLLNKFRDGEYQNVYRWLGALQSTYGCEWPELNTIKRSLDAEVFKLTEGTDEEYETATKNLEALIMDMKESLAWVKERPNANVFPLNNLSRIEFMVRRGEIYRENILPDIDRLEKFGIDWDELSIIKRSLRHELANAKNQIQENTEIDKTQTSSNGKHEKEAHSLIDYINDQIIEHANNFDIASQFTHAENMIDQLNIQSSAFEYLDPNKVKNILRWFKQTLSNDPYYAFRSMPFFTKTQFQLSYVRKFINELKPKLIPHLLRYFKDGMPGRAAVYAERLKDLGITWPELDTIIKSGQVELKRMHDAGQFNENIKKINKVPIMNRI